MKSQSGVLSRCPLYLRTIYVPIFNEFTSFHYLIKRYVSDGVSQEKFVFYGRLYTKEQSLKYS